MPRTKKRAHAGPAAQSKAEFVRSQPDSLGAKDVVKAAKAAGIPISEAYVYTIRYEAKRRGQKKAGRPAGRKGGRGRAASAGPRDSANVEALLLAAAAEVGLSRAIALLQEQQRALRAVLGR